MKKKRLKVPRYSLNNLHLRTMPSLLLSSPPSAPFICRKEERVCRPDTTVDASRRLACSLSPLSSCVSPLCPLPLSLITLPSLSFPPVSVSLSLGLFLLYLTPSHPPAACCARASHRQGPQASDRVLFQGVFLPLSAHFVRARSCMRVPNNMIIIHAQCACVRARECAFVRAREYLSLAES